MILKKEFLDKLINIVMDFEVETGVEFKNIHFERIEITEGGQLSKRSAIESIKLELK